MNEREELEKRLEELKDNLNAEFLIELNINQLNK